ncbi:hypothetical protein GIB67_027231, partial [Kingdonia uniflora]
TSSLEVYFVSYSNISKTISTHNQAPQGTLVVEASIADKPSRTNQHIIAVEHIEDYFDS